MRIIPLSEWYPEMLNLWVREGRRYLAPERTAYTIHHTLGGGTVAELRYAQDVADYHYFAKQWYRPGGYNFQIGTLGSIFSMCGWEYVGAHAPGGNRTTIGVAFQGSFGTKLPNAQQLAAFAWLVSNHSVPNTQWGHRDWGNRSCPGDTLYAALPLSILEDDMTPEDRQLLEQAARDAALARHQTQAILDALDGRLIGDDLRRIRLTDRAIADRFGLPTEHEVAGGPVPA